MTRFLCISVTFLDRLFHGKGDDEPEWPPSPMRLFQALLAGARTGCRQRDWSIAKAEAFRWLECRHPPAIVAPTARLMSGCTLFVPNNDSDRVFDRQERLTSKLKRPHRLCDGEAVHYLWLIDEHAGAEGDSHAQILCEEARHLLALGWGIDQVVGNGRILNDVEVAALPGERWLPASGYRPGVRCWRVPKAGSLADLEQIHRSFLDRVDRQYYKPPLKPTRFDLVTYRRDDALPCRSYAAFELPEGVAFRQEDVAKVGAMLRSLAGRCAKDDTHQFPGGSETYVAGHAGKQGRTPARFSYLPLPSIGQEYADGMIRRLLIAEPFGDTGTHARWAQRRLRNATLRDKDGASRGILLDLWRPESRRVLRRYVGRTRVWSTVTPVILPGFDDGKRAKAEKLLLSALQQADVPPGAVVDVTLRKAPFWSGSQHPRQYFRPDYLRNLPGWHVRLEFREPASGPLAIGAGRHTGLGLFAHPEG